MTGFQPAQVNVEFKCSRFRPFKIRNKMQELFAYTRNVPVEVLRQSVIHSQLLTP